MPIFFTIIIIIFFNFLSKLCTWPPCVRVFSSGGADQSTVHGLVPGEILDDVGGGNPLRFLGGQQEDLLWVGQLPARAQAQRVSVATCASILNGTVIQSNASYYNRSKCPHVAAAWMNLVRCYKSSPTWPSHCCVNPTPPSSGSPEERPLR